MTFMGTPRLFVGRENPKPITDHNDPVATRSEGSLPVLILYCPKCEDDTECKEFDQFTSTCLTCDHDFMPMTREELYEQARDWAMEFKAAMRGDKK